METIAEHLSLLPGNAGSASNMIVEGTVVNSVAAALVELSNVHNVTAVVLERGNVFILLHHTTWGAMSKNVYCPNKVLKK